MDNSSGPIFTAVSSSARQLYLLLRCIGFSSKATVQITGDGLRFSVEDSRTIQGLAFLDRHLFTSFTFNAPPSSSADPLSDASSDTVVSPLFQISLAAFLETLQIFGISDPNLPYSHPTSTSNTTAFNAPALALGGTCTLTYAYTGAPLSITLTEAGVTTTCDLTTYEPPDVSSASDETIPLQRDALTLKIIMRSTYLADAISELASTNPTTLTLSASASTPPYFALESSGGPFGDSVVEFAPEAKKPAPPSTTTPVTDASNRPTPAVTETFGVSSSAPRIRRRYRFALVRRAARAMALASKVSIRGDVQGVLSLQFMIEVGDAGGRANGGGGPPSAVGAGKARSFVDFRFVPLLDDDDDDDDGGGGDEE